jgi:hypothetical protein
LDGCNVLLRLRINNTTYRRPSGAVAKEKPRRRRRRREIKEFLRKEKK